METLLNRGTDKTNSSAELAKVVGVVGENISVKCLLNKFAYIRKPPSECIQDYSKCRSFFQPHLYLQRRGNPGPVLVTYEDHADSGRYSLSYGQSALLVGIRGLTKADMGQYVCGVRAPSGDDSSGTFEVIVEDAVAEANGRRRLLLLLLIPALLLLMAGGLRLLIIYKKGNSNCESPKADTSGEINEVVLYENCRAPASEPADSTYQTLSADTRDHAHIYNTLNTQ
ncbi:uncharacterized protein [Eucyclogobius newberryi]|uniref:uncharacterized protein n=1 Tax=Eucyclogobius newberryi TaxID=166745 RepID=UPI003B593C58